jgi:3-isopropylmalate/(R)-2-methylmalate dehydratase small subunit
VLNRPEYQGVSILVVGDNFGCGSSREHAVWAIQDYGIRVVIAPSFADIFRGNSGNAGLLLAEVSKDVVEELWKMLPQNPELEITVNLEEQVVSFGSSVEPFKINQHTRHKLLNGLDDIEITLSRTPDIEVFELARPSWRPRI